LDCLAIEQALLDGRDVSAGRFFKPVRTFYRSHEVGLKLGIDWQACLLGTCPNVTDGYPVRRLGSIIERVIRFVSDLPELNLRLSIRSETCGYFYLNEEINEGILIQSCKYPSI